MIQIENIDIEDIEDTEDTEDTKPKTSSKTLKPPKKSKPKMSLEERNRLQDFKRNRSVYIMTTRFNNSNCITNREYIRMKEKMQCIYCSPYQIAREIPLESKIFVLEMNNDTNKIMGIGMIRNHHHNYKFSVYDTNKSYHRFTYVGHYHIRRQDMSVEENVLLQYLDRKCFYGNHHLKRGRGLTQLPCSLQYDLIHKMNFDATQFIKIMFRKRFSQRNDANHTNDDNTNNTNNTEEVK
jgi:hypothetical protein